MTPAARPEKPDSLKSALGRLVGPSKPDDDSPRLVPACWDAKSTCKEMVVFVDLPGVDEDDISIAVESRALKVSVLREFDHDNEDAEEYTHIGRPYGLLSCSVALPPNADTDRMTAKYKRGVLKVRIPLEAA